MIALLACANISVMAQVSTPNTGVNWNLDSLVANFPSAFSLDTNVYAQIQDLTVSKNDTIAVNSAQWMIDTNIRITVEGTFITNGTASAPTVLTSFDTITTWDGLRFEDSSFVSLNQSYFTYSGGLRVLTENFSMDSCEVFYSHANGTSSSAALNFSRGKPSITNSNIYLNEQAAIGSGANQEVSAYIYNCVIAYNSLSNANRPQINLGPTHVDDTTYVLNSYILGDSTLDKVGGVSVSSLLGGQNVNAIIDSNVITNNRYGVTMYNATYGRITNNMIIDNNTETNPMNGGSGISVYNGSGLIASGNTIAGNLWGVTIIGSANINLGDTSAANYNVGKNTFYNNGNGGVTYAVYNNTPNTIMAQNNCWTGDSTATLADAEAVIFHQNDDASLGEVIFDPIWDCTEPVDSTSGIHEESVAQLEVYPNPSTASINVQSEGNGMLYIYNTSGVLINRFNVQHGNNHIEHQLKAGIYVLSLSAEGIRYRSKLIVN